MSNYLIIGLIIAEITAGMPAVAARFLMEGIWIPLMKKSRIYRA